MEPSPLWAVTGATAFLYPLERHVFCFRVHKLGVPILCFHLVNAGGRVRPKHNKQTQEHSQSDNYNKTPIILAAKDNTYTYLNGHS